MIIFLYGADAFRSRKKLKEIKAKFLSTADMAGDSLITLDGRDITMERLNEKISPRSLLTKKRLLAVEDIFLNKNKDIFTAIPELFKTRKTLLEDNTVIFRDSSVRTDKKGKAVAPDSLGREKPLAKEPAQLFKYLRQQKYAQEFKLLSNTETAAWIKNEVKMRGGTIGYKAVQALLGLIGAGENSGWQLENEINKLINYKRGLTPGLIGKNEPVAIEEEDVEKLVRGSFDENIFALTDALSAKNKQQAEKLLENQYEAGLTDGYLLNMIIRQFKILLQIRQALDSGFTARKIAGALKLHPFVVQKGISQARNFTPAVLKNILNTLMTTDYRLKTGQADACALLNLLIAKI